MTHETHIRSFESFAALIANHFELASVPTRSERPQSDLRFDSLALFELYVLLSDLRIELSPDAFTEHEVTFGRLYDLAVQTEIDAALRRDLRNV